ncbi:MAG TPA: hypothetical protein VFV38_28265 [Ktedonobacteraceae bacterium]|nr:hypothetical protein [Ktedonobacteraceae bacterium]
MSQLADHVALLEEAVELAMSNHTVEDDLKATEAALAEWKERAANYEGDLEDTSLRGSTRANIRHLLDTAYERVEELENHRAELAVFGIDMERERVEFEKILAWCRKAKQDREELTYTQKRDFLHMIGAVVFATRVGNKASAPLWDIKVPLPAIQSIIYQGTMARSQGKQSLELWEEDDTIAQELQGDGAELDNAVVEQGSTNDDLQNVLPRKAAC